MMISINRLGLYVTFLLCLMSCASTTPTSLNPQKVQQCEKNVNLMLKGVIKKGMTQDEIRNLLGDPHWANETGWYWVGALARPPSVLFDGDGKVTNFSSGSVAGCHVAGNWG